MALEDDHHHCRVCGAVCAATATVCSAKCQATRDRTIAQRRRLQYAFYAAILIALFVLSLQFRI